MLDSTNFSVATAQALAFLDFLGHWSVKCPVPLQNMQRLLLSCHLRSLAINLPSLPRLLVKSGFEELDEGCLFGLDKPEELPVLDFS